MAIYRYLKNNCRLFILCVSYFSLLPLLCGTLGPSPGTCDSAHHLRGNKTAFPPPRSHENLEITDNISQEGTGDPSQGASVRPGLHHQCLTQAESGKTEIGAMCDGNQNPAAVPTLMPDTQGDGRWMSVHNHFVSSSKDKEPEVVFIGDSMVQLLHQFEIWRDLFSPLHALNFGGLGEGTQHVLWRMENGELKHIKPKIIVLWVGTFNQGHTAEQISGGIQAIVRCMQERQPQAKVVVLGLLPRGKNRNSLRDRNKQVNELLTEAMPSMPNAMFLDVDPGFVHSDGTISHNDMYDYLHLSRQGYARVCQPVHKALLQLLEGRGVPTRD